MAEERIQRRISALLSLAAHPNTPEEERARAQAQADELMAKYNVQQALLNWEKPIEERRKPTTMILDRLDLVDPHSMNVRGKSGVEYQINGVVMGMRRNAYQFAGVRYHHGYSATDKQWVYSVIGYEEDVYYGELLWNLIFQEILRSMYPGWSNERSMDDNVYYLKNAGYSWPQIREMGIANEAKDHLGPLTSHNAASKLRTAYGRAAKKRGEDPKPKTIRDPHWWRLSYVDSFSVRIQQRFAALKQDREEYFDKKNLPALQQQESAVDEAFWEMFPDMHPDEVKKRQEEAAERQRKWNEEHKDDKPVKATKTKSPRYYDEDAWNAGHSAAERVKISQDKAFDKKEAIG